MSAREGWTVGLFIPGPDWLTVPGSAYVEPTLYDTAEEAIAARASYVAKRAWGSPVVVARVRAVSHPGVSLGSAFRVIGRDAEADAVLAECLFWEAHYAEVSQ